MIQCATMTVDLINERRNMNNKYIDEIPNYPDPEPMVVEEMINLEDAVHKNDPGERDDYDAEKFEEADMAISSGEKLPSWLN